MMKFLLHGGQLRYEDTRNDAYFRELTNGLYDGDNVLFIGFARRDETDRQQVYERDKGYILAQTELDLTVTNATHDDFMEQVTAAQAIHITGGATDELVRYIRQYPGFIAAIAGKAVGGSSAGACLFSTHYFYSYTEQVLEGLGTLPIRLHVHANPEFEATAKAIAMLEQYPHDLELVLVEECAWITREVG
jgi:peptidase E